jgi:hypothetical protein
MNANKFAVGLCGLALWTSAPAYSQQTTVAPNDDPKRLLVGRLDLERYKATLRGLGQYGDRQQGTDRNRAAVDWIEAQLRSYGCAPEGHRAFDPLLPPIWRPCPYMDFFPYGKIQYDAGLANVGRGLWMSGTSSAPSYSPPAAMSRARTSAPEAPSKSA